MITCTFVGTHQYDLDLYEKIQTAVETVISKGDEIEFLFYRRTEEFYHLCFLAVLKAKHQFPRKKITMTLITKQSENEENRLWIEWREFPKWVFDKITPVILGPEKETLAAAPWKKIERKMVRQSNYVIACCYPELRESEYALFKYSTNQKHVFIFNLLNDETTNFIGETIKSLPPNERPILEQINEGCTYTSLAKAAGVSVAAIQTRDSRGRKRLRTRAMERLKQERIKQGPTAPEICSVILPGGPTSEPDEVRTRFRHIADFLSKNIGVSGFMIEQSNCPSKCMSELIWKREELELIVVTHYSEQDGMDLTAIQVRYIPPFTKVVNIDPEVKPLWARYLRGIKAMLGRSEYVICNLSETSPINDRIRRYIEKQKRITVIDLGNSPRIATPQPLIDP